MHEDCATFVLDPATVGGKAGCVPAASVKGENGNELDGAFWDVQDINKFQHVSTSNMQLNVPNTNCMHSRDAQGELGLV